MDRKKRAAFLSIVLVPVLFLCGKQEAQAAIVTIDPPVVEIGVDEQATVQVTCSNCFSPLYFFSIANPSVATVSVVSKGPLGATLTVTGVSEGSTVLSAMVLQPGESPITVIAGVIVTEACLLSCCPAEAALEGDPRKETKLEILRDFRDEVLASTPMGQRYIELFYKHAEEGVELILSYPELLSHTQTLLEEFLPTIQAIVAGPEVTVTTADLAEVGALLEAFAEKARPELQADIRAIQEELRQRMLREQFRVRVEHEAH